MRIRLRSMMILIVFAALAMFVYPDISEDLHAWLWVDPHISRSANGTTITHGRFCPDQPKQHECPWYVRSFKRLGLMR